MMLDGEAAGRRQAGPDIRPLGFLAVGLAVVSLLLALSVFYSWLTYLPAALALTLGVIARGEEPVRGSGTVAVVLASVAILLATAVVLSYF